MMYAATNSIVQPNLLIWTYSDPRVLRADPLADFEILVSSTKLST